jgi:IPT/TIG domain
MWLVRQHDLLHVLVCQFRRQPGFPIELVLVLHLATIRGWRIGGDFLLCRRVGNSNGTIGNQLMELGLVSALVGLFSDKAVKKLSDILDVLLATKDDRTDNVADGKSHPTPPATAVPAKPAASGTPKIDTVTPSSLAANKAATVQVRGSGFKSGCKVKVNEQEATPMEQTEQSFKVAITAALAQPPNLTITVTADQGTASVGVPVSE